MSRSCQSATFSRPTMRVAPHEPREPADPLRHDRVALVRHGRGALLATHERLLDLPHLRAGQMADLESEAVEGRGEQRKRREELRMAVSLQDLRRARRGLEPEASHVAARPRATRRSTCRRRRSASRPACPRGRFHAPPVARELERPARKLQAERHRLGVDAVRTADSQRVPMFLCPLDDHRRTRGRFPRARARPRPARRARARCRARPTTSVRSGTSVRPARALPRPRRRTRRRRGSSCARARRPAPGSEPSHARGYRATTSAGNVPMCSHASSAASSTASHLSSFASSDQMRVIAGRE